MVEVWKVADVIRCPATSERRSAFGVGDVLASPSTASSPLAHSHASKSRIAVFLQFHGHAAPKIPSEMPSSSKLTALAALSNDEQSRKQGSSRTIPTSTSIPSVSALHIYLAYLPFLISSNSQDQHGPPLDDPTPRHLDLSEVESERLRLATPTLCDAREAARTSSATN